MTMDRQESMQRARNKRAFSHLDRFAVVNSESGEPVEGHFNRATALNAADNLNGHERHYGRALVYTVEPLEA